MQQLHWGWAVPGALLLGAAIVWWTQSAEDTHGGPAATQQADAQHQARNHDDAGPTLYRWVDAGGVVNFSTDKPPAGRHYTIVHVNPNQNIVPMTVNKRRRGFNRERALIRDGSKIYES